MLQLCILCKGVRFLTPNTLFDIIKFNYFKEKVKARNIDQSSFIPSHPSREGNIKVIIEKRTKIMNNKTPIMQYVIVHERVNLPSTSLADISSSTKIRLEDLDFCIDNFFSLKAMFALVKN